MDMYPYFLQIKCERNVFQEICDRNILSFNKSYELKQHKYSCKKIYIRPIMRNNSRKNNKNVTKNYSC